MAHRSAVLAPGQVLRVGKDERAAAFVVASDTGLAPAHFELSWDGSRGWLIDLGTSTGTLLDGQRVEMGEVFNGSWVRAGRTDFSIYFERATPQPIPAKPDSAEMMSRKENALQVLREQQTHLFAILDASADERILQLLRESVAEFLSLYEGPRGESLEDIAPYLVVLPPDSGLLGSLVHEGWGKNWGVYLRCHHPLQMVRRHLRKLLMVEAEGQQGRFYFRFYDPRVLRSFLETCDASQRRDFFGAIERFILEGPDGLPRYYPHPPGADSQGGTGEQRTQGSSAP
jgi:hypothetical protein